MKNVTKGFCKKKANTNITNKLIPKIDTNVDRYSDKSSDNCACLKNLKPDNPTQSENIIHRKDKNAIDNEYNPYCSGKRRFVYIITDLSRRNFTNKELLDYYLENRTVPARKNILNGKDEGQASTDKDKIEQIIKESEEIQKLF